VLRWCPPPESTSVSALVQRLDVHTVTVSDDGLVVALDCRVDDSDSAVARRVDIDAVENVGAACQ